MHDHSLRAEPCLGAGSSIRGQARQVGSRARLNASAASCRAWQPGSLQQNPVCALRPPSAAQAARSCRRASLRPPCVPRQGFAHSARERASCSSVAGPFAVTTQLSRGPLSQSHRHGLRRTAGRAGNRRTSGRLARQDGFHLAHAGSARPSPRWHELRSLGCVTSAPARAGLPVAVRSGNGPFDRPARLSSGRIPTGCARAGSKPPPQPASLPHSRGLSRPGDGRGAFIVVSARDGGEPMHLDPPLASMLRPRHHRHARLRCLNADGRRPIPGPVGDRNGGLWLAYGLSADGKSLGIAAGTMAVIQLYSCCANCWSRLRSRFQHALPGEVMRRTAGQAATPSSRWRNVACLRPMHG